MRINYRWLAWAIDVVLLVVIWTIIIAFVMVCFTGCADLHALAGEFLPKIEFVEVPTHV